MTWRPISEFDPEAQASVRRDRLLIAGTSKFGIKWIDCTYWNQRGWFTGHVDVTHWQPMPCHPDEEPVFECRIPACHPKEEP